MWPVNNSIDAMPGDRANKLHAVTEDSIGLLVDRFYARVRRDPVLAPVFDATIDTAAWPEHLTTLKNFWSSVMLSSGRYSGNPVAVHRAVQGLEPPMFPHWLRLFADTADSLFAPDIASQFASKARRIAMSLELAVFHRNSGGAPCD